SALKCAGKAGGRAMESNTARATMATVLAGGLGFAVYAVTLQAGSHTDGRIVMAVGNPHYRQLAEGYRSDLERNGVRLELGELEGFKTLKALGQKGSGVQRCFGKGRPGRQHEGRARPRPGKGPPYRVRQTAVAGPPVLRADLGLHAP